MLTLSSYFATPVFPLPSKETLSLQVAFKPALASQPIVLLAQLAPVMSTHLSKADWTYVRKVSARSASERRLSNGEYIPPLIEVDEEEGKAN